MTEPTLQGGQKMWGKALPVLLTILVLFFTLTPNVSAQDFDVPTFNFVEPSKDPRQVVTTLEIFIIITILSVAPAILLMTTCFTRIIVVLSFLRQSMALQQLPPNQVMVGLALFLTFMIMGPTWGKVYDDAIDPYMNNVIGTEEATARAEGHIRYFMWRQLEVNNRMKDVELFCGIVGKKNIQTKEEVPTWVLVPAYMISELKIAFQIGFLLFLPFLVIDMIIASVLMSMGMMMLPPVMISMPFKILLFVLVDGWHLIVTQLMQGFPAPI